MKKVEGYREVIQFQAETTDTYIRYPNCHKADCN